jgi:toxin ParE1/3/4
MASEPKSAKLLKIVLVPAARSDIREALAWSQEHFGERAAVRYRNLIKQAIRDITSNPERPGSVERAELARGVHTYHLFLSRDRAKSESGRVGRPRHFLVYRRRGNTIDLVRILHDVRDFERNLPRDFLKHEQSGSGETPG